MRAKVIITGEYDVNKQMHRCAACGEWSPIEYRRMKEEDGADEEVYRNQPRCQPCRRSPQPCKRCGGAGIEPKDSAQQELIR